MNFIEISTGKYPISEASINFMHLGRKDFVPTVDANKYLKFGYAGVRDDFRPATADIFKSVREKAPAIIEGNYFTSYEVIESDFESSAVKTAFKKKLFDFLNNHLNSVAINKGFDSIGEAVTYAEEPAVPEYQALGRALRAWRSLVWKYHDSLVAEVTIYTKNVKLSVTTESELLAALPKLEV